MDPLLTAMALFGGASMVFALMALVADRWESEEHRDARQRNHGR